MNCFSCLSKDVELSMVDSVEYLTCNCCGEIFCDSDDGVIYTVDTLGAKNEFRAY